METIPDWAQDAPSVPDWAQPNPRDFIKPAPGELVNPVSTKSRLGAGTQLLPTAKDISNALPDAETVHEVAADVTRPAVALPKFTVNPNDSKVMAVAKSAANLGISLPEFAESPLGVATMGAGSVMPRVVAALFAADTGRNVKQQASELGSQWDTLTPAQKAAALTDITGNTLLTATLGHGATKGRVTPSDVQLEAKPLPDTPVNPVVQAVKPTPPPVEAASPDALAGLQTAMRQRQLAPKPPVQPSAATGGTLTPPPAESVPTGNVGANKAIQGATPIDTINKVAAMTPQELSAAFPMGPNNLTASAWRLGQSLTKPEELQALKAAQANAKGFEGQFFREAYEAATGTGSAGYALSKDPKYQPPFPVTDNPPTVKEGGSPAKDAPVSAGGNAGNLSNPAGEKVSSLPIKSNENESSPRSSAIPQPSQPAPASPVKSALIRQGTGELVKDRTDEQWNILHENLIDDLDSYHSARNTGSVDYDLRDNLAKFMEEARKNNGDMTMGEAWKSFKGQLSDSHAKKIQSALKNQGVDLTTSKARQGTGESPKLEKVKTGSVDTPAQGSLNQALKLKADTWKRVQSIRQKIKANPIQTGNLRVDLIKAESAHREALQMERDARAGIETRANEQGQTTKPTPKPSTPAATPAAAVKESLTPEERQIEERSTPRKGTPERERYDAAVDAAIKAADDAYTNSSELAEQYKAAKYGSAKKDMLAKRQEAASSEYSKLKPAADAARKRYVAAGIEDLADANLPIVSDYAKVMAEAARQKVAPQNPSSRISNVERARNKENVAYEQLREDLEMAYRDRGLTPEESKSEALNHLSSLTSWPLAEGPKIIERLDRMAEVVKEQRAKDKLLKQFDEIDSPVQGTQRDRFRQRIEAKHAPIEESQKALDEYRAWVREENRKLDAETAAKQKSLDAATEKNTSELKPQATTKFSLSDYGGEKLVSGRYASNGRMMLDLSQFTPPEAKKIQSRPKVLSGQGADIAQEKAVKGVWTPNVEDAKTELVHVGYRLNKEGTELSYFVDPKSGRYWAIDSAFERLIYRGLKNGAKKVMGNAKSDKNTPVVFFNNEHPAAVVMPFAKGEGADINVSKALELSGKTRQLPESADLSSGKLGKTPISRGPGAAAEGEPGTYSPIQAMADRLATTAEAGKPIDTQLHAMDKAKAALSDVKDSVKRSLATLTAVHKAIWKKYTGLPEYGDEQRAVGKWFYALQRADAEARNFAKQIVKAVPSKLRREAITNWIQADGDAAVLKERAAASTGTLKQGYEAAQNLTPHEQEIAQMLRDYYDQQLQNGIDAGILKDGLENYITQVWKKENPITRKLVSDLAFGKLQPNFKYAKKRIFDSYFEGEQAGYIPQKDAGFLVANYDQSFNKSLAARAFIKDLHEGKASDGRPLVELSGNGKVLEQTDGRSLEQGKTVFIKPHAKPEELNDYRTIDHPALRGWKWAGNTPEGSPIIMQGDMLVHPEAYQKLKNRLSVSAFRQLPATRALLGVQTGIKQTMLSISGFHQVQETLHALGHRVNPMNLPELDFSEPVTRSLVEHGLQLADYNALADFGEGLAGGGLTAKIPGIGPKLNQYNEWLFQDYIPRLKLGMAKEALERNQKRYPNLPGDKVLELTAGEANAAFGELPYKYWGRSPTLQDAWRTFLLAPDFLEARARFTGRALSPFGREQLVALGLLAATQYIAARITNYAISNDPHWEPKNAFRIVAHGHAYGLRTIPGDMLHLFTDTRGFFYNRMSPMLRTATEYITARDAQGVKRDIMEQVKDLAKMPIPISMRSRLGQKWWEAFLNSFGVQEQRYDAVQTIQQKAAEWKQAQGIKNAVEITYNADADKYAALRSAIEDGQQARAQQEFDKLKATMPPAKIYEHFKLSETHPITGSRANDAKFVASLDEAGKQEYQEAQQLRQARLRMVQSLH